LSAVNLRLKQVYFILLGMRNRDKKKVIGVALFIHVLDKLPEVSLVGGCDVGAKGGCEKVAVVGLCVGHGVSLVGF
jgi:hypothetical protein